MGSVSTCISGKGTSMVDAFNSLVSEARQDYGTDYYSGEFNNAELASDWTHKYNGKNIDKLYDEALKKMGKNEIVGICTKKPKPNKNKTKSTVERIPQKGARKWVTMYVGTVGWDGNEFVCEAKTLTECVKKARAYTEKTQRGVNIDIVKRLEKGNNKCARVEYKKSKTEQLGTYEFMGWLSC